MASVIANRHKTAASDRRCVLGFAHALFVAAAWGRFGARLRVRGTGCRRGAQRAAGPRRFADGLEPPIALLAESAPGASKAARRRKAVAAMAGLASALLLARAIGKRELSDRILESDPARTSGRRAPLRRRSRLKASFRRAIRYRT